MRSLGNIGTFSGRLVIGVIVRSPFQRVISLRLGFRRRKQAFIASPELGGIDLTGKFPRIRRLIEHVNRLVEELENMGVMPNDIGDKNLGIVLPGVGVSIEIHFLHDQGVEKGLESEEEIHAWDWPTLLHGNWGESPREERFLASCH
jgi:hypothetical protein